MKKKYIFIILILIVLVMLFFRFYGYSSLKFNGTSIRYKTPKNYEITYETDATKTYQKNSQTVQYTVYEKTVDDAIEMDKEIVNEMKNSSDFSNVKDEEFTINNTKCYQYSYNNGGEKYVIIAYKRVNNYTLVITLTDNKKIDKNDIANFL